MKKQILMAMALMLMVPAGVMAMSHGEHGDHGKKMEMDHSKMDHSKMDHGEKMKMDHSKMEHGKKMAHGDGMSMGGNMIMLQDEEVDGVMGSAHMMDVKEKMAEHGMAMTHHIMIGFMDTEGETISDGAVAVKIESPDGNVSKPIKLMGMSGAFGADITLDQKGMYHFKFGTKLADGKKRTFHMHYDNK